jgi:hypothetical protein
MSAIWLIKKSQPQRKQKVTIETILTAFIIVFFTLSMSPNLEQSLYWRSAMLPYLMPIVGNTILIGIVLHDGEDLRPSSWRKFTIFALAFLAGGFSETGVALQTGYLAFWMIFSVIKEKGKTINKHRLYPLIGIAFMGTAIAILLLVISPTNPLRRANLALPVPPNFPSLLQMSIKNAYLFTYSSIRWLFLPHFLIFLYFSTQSWLYNSDKFSNHSISLRSFSISMVLLPFVTFGLLMCVVAPSAWAQSSYPVARALVMGRLITVMASAIGGWIIGRIIKQISTGLTIKDSIRFVATMLIMIAIAAFPIMEVKNVLGELHRYQRWSTAWDARDQLIREARAAGIVEIDVMEIDHIIPDVTELKPDPDFWYNNCAEWYYDLRRISASQGGWDD